jgi:TPR repeat protein
MLAQDRKKLISAEAESGATPAPLRSGPRIDLAIRDRAKFRTGFQALIVELDKLLPTKGDAKALPDALIKARAALLKPILPDVGPRWRTAGLFAAAVAALFVVGFGTGRLIAAVRAGEFLVATPRAEASTTAAPAPSVSDISMAELERQPWREVVARIDANAAERIKANAVRGEPLAQSLSCLAHLGGAEGFLPSPMRAREQCDAAAAQNDAAGLYFSWVLHREAPHAGVSEAQARERLAQAAELGWTSALIDYALSLGPERQAEAGRFFLTAAEKNDPRGQVHYARWLRDSPAGPRDPSAAIPYLELAARSGQLDAVHMLATLYRDGVGAPRDPGRAQALYEQAARGGHAPAMFNLADLLRDGGDRARAIELYRALACMPDERQIQPMAQARLRALQESARCR